MTVRSEEIEEEADYVNIAMCSVDKTGTASDQKFPSFTKSFPPLAVCWVTLLIFTSLRIYFTSVMSANNTKLTVENQRLTARIQELETQNQELETQKNNLTEKIQDMETKWNELNISLAQWSIDAYCPREKANRQCKPCQDGWSHSQSSCYGINDAWSPYWTTWDEAQADCKGKISDLAVIDNQVEKKFINDHSWESSGTSRYWIGLRVEDGKWKWVDGTDLAETSWIQHPTDGHCAISVQNQGWKSVNCGDKNMWICEKVALSV